MSDTEGNDFGFLDDIGEDPTEVLEAIDKGPEVTQTIEDTEAYKDEIPTEEEFVPVTENNEEAETDERDDLPAIQGDDIPTPYLAIVQGILLQYSYLPIIDYNSVYSELSELSVKSEVTPTLQVINDEIQKVQSAKDRLSEIYCDVLRNYYFKKRSVDILESAWSKYTNEKSADKRKGDCTYRTSEFSFDFGKIESLVKVCQHILKNLDSVHDGLSRRITVNQLLLKMNDMGRGSLPFQDFTTRPLDDGLDPNSGLLSDGGGSGENESEDESFKEENF